MKNFFKQIFIFLVVFALFLSVLYLLSPPFLGNTQFTEKIHIFNPMKDKINTVFLGNSTVNRHVNPVTFDRNTTSKTVSFNLASDATPMMERSYLVEYLLKNYSLERIVVLVSHSADIREENMHTLRVSYYHDLKRLKYGLSYRAEKEEQVKFHYISYVENLLSIFKFQPLLDYYFAKSTSHRDLYKKRGFLALDVQYDDGFQQAMGYRKRPEKHLEKLEKSSRKVNYSRYKVTDKDRIITKECRRLKQLGDEHGTEIIFLFMPNAPYYYHYEMENKLYLGDSDEFSAFYEFENRYNPGHLNSVGAELFSVQLAKKYNDYVARQKTDGD